MCAKCQATEQNSDSYRALAGESSRQTAGVIRGGQGKLLRHSRGVVPDSDKLLRAVDRGLVEPLRQFGYRATGMGSLRGEMVELSNGAVMITLSADWLEGELDIRMAQREAKAVPLRELVEVQGLGIHLSRLPRAVTAASLEGTMRIAEPCLVKSGDARRPRVVTSPTWVMRRSASTPARGWAFSPRMTTAGLPLNEPPDRWHHPVALHRCQQLVGRGLHGCLECSEI
jgi:hypothetical protein